MMPIPLFLSKTNSQLLALITNTTLFAGYFADPLDIMALSLLIAVIPEFAHYNMQKTFIALSSIYFAFGCTGSLAQNDIQMEALVIAAISVYCTFQCELDTQVQLAHLELFRAEQELEKVTIQLSARGSNDSGSTGQSPQLPHTNRLLVKQSTLKQSNSVYEVPKTPSIENSSEIVFPKTQSNTSFDLQFSEESEEPLRSGPRLSQKSSTSQYFYMSDNSPELPSTHKELDYDQRELLLNIINEQIQQRPEVEAVQQITSQSQVDSNTLDALTQQAPYARPSDKARARLSIRPRYYSVDIQIPEENDKMQKYLKNIGKWDFETLKIIQKSREPIVDVGLYVYGIFELTSKFNINIKSLKNFTQIVDKSYKPVNYYHNSIHGADVTCSVVFLIHNGLQPIGTLTYLEIFALLTSALCHDIGHPGVNNAFMVATNSKLALFYNDNSVLESMHASTVFKLLQNPDYNIVTGLSKEDFFAFRKILIDTILATDLSRHFMIVKDFNSMIEDPKNTTLEGDIKNATLKVMLKCADIGHGAKKLPIHKEWSALLLKEFFEQGEKERAQSLPVSPLCDKENVVICSSQKDFLSYITRPMYDAFYHAVLKFTEFTGNPENLPVHICIRNIQENIDFWDEELQRYENNQPLEFVLDNKPPIMTVRLSQ